MTPSFNENGLHTFDFLGSSYCLYTTPRKEKRQWCPTVTPTGYTGTDVPYNLAEWLALCNEITSCHKMQEMV